MRKELIKIMVFCAACLVLGAQGQTGTGTAGDKDNNKENKYGGTPGSSSQYSSDRLSATGRMGHHEVRLSKLMGAQVKSSSGENLGTINDVVLNPASGRIDFAVISYSETGSTGTSSSSSTAGTSSSTSTGTSGTRGITGTTGSLSAGKLVAIPWTLLRPAEMGGSSTTTTPGMEQHTFTFTGDKSKLEGAPSFDQSNWPDINGPEWRRSIFTYFGVQPGSATGGAGYTPGGTSSGTSTDSSTGKTPDSTTPTPDKP